MQVNKGDLFFEKGLTYARNHPGRPTKYILVLSAGEKKIKTISFMKHKGSTVPDEELRVKTEVEDAEYFGRWSKYIIVSQNKKGKLIDFILTSNSVIVE